MRVALIGPVPPRLGGATPGGVATHQVHLAAGLAAAGTYAPLLATNTRARPQAAAAADAKVPFPLYRMGRPDLATLGPYLQSVGARRTARYAFELARSAHDSSRREVLANVLWYRRFLAEIGADLIHVQHPLERSTYARHVLRFEGWQVPVVVTAHSLFGEHSAATIERLMAPNLRAADRVIAVSPHIAEQAQQLGVPARRLTVIRSGVDVEYFRPRSRGRARQMLGLRPETPVVLFVGNLEPRKQVDVLLRALVCVRAAVPDAVLMVVGSGESAGEHDQTAALQRLTQELGLADGDAVRFVGRVQDGTLLEYYAAADVFALPSSSEAQGIVALEAMACGLPVVASAVGGLVGTIDDGCTGYLVAAGEPAPLADRLTRLLVDEGQRQAIGAAARTAVERGFSWARTVAATRAVYEEVLAESRPPVPHGDPGALPPPRRGVATLLQRWRSGRSSDVLVIPLGELARADVEAVIERQFGAGLALTWLDRDQLRRRPLVTLGRLMRQRYEMAVLVAPDLRQPRLRVTGFVLGLARANRHWLTDLRGNREAFGLGAHLAVNLWPIARHVIACGLAIALREPLLGAIDRSIQPRHVALTRPKRVLYLRSQLWLGLEGGGSVAHTAGVVRGLEQAGVAVDVVSSDRLPGVLAPTVVVVPEMWFDGWRREIEDLAYNLAFFTATWRTARRVHPQVIYQRHTSFNCSGAVLSRVSKLPLVLEFNSSEVWKGRYWGGLRLAHAAMLVERINLRAADRVVVVSRVLADYVRSAGVPAHKILVNPNGVDPAQFHPDVDGTAVRRRLGLPDSAVVGFSGTFGNWHGIPALAEALARVCRARPDVHWLLIGDGPLRHLVDGAVEDNDLADRVHRPGLVPHAHMPAYLAACDVLVSPHGRQVDGGEFFGSPTKLFEYMAAGRPIVASGIGQIAEVLQHEQTALLVAPDDPEALAAAIVRLVDDACLRHRLGQAARQAAVERHTWRQNADRSLASLGG